MREGLLGSLNRPILKGLDSEGIDDVFLVKKLKEELDASLPKLFQSEGNVIESREIPVRDIRQCARQDAHKLLGHYPDERHRVSIEGFPRPELTEEQLIEVKIKKQLLLDQLKGQNGESNGE